MATRATNVLKVEDSGDVSVTMGTTIDPVNDGIRTYPEATDVNLTASALVKTGSGRVQGVVVNSNTSGTLKLWDNTAASGSVVINTYTFPAGSSTIPLFGMSFSTGLYATIGGTADISIAYN